MRLYRATAADGGIVFCSTQAEARSIVQDIGGCWVLEEVPTDKPGLISWLNTEETERVAGAIPARTPSDRATGLTATAIQEWLLDTATQGEVESVFACLGARFAEARRRPS